MQKRIIEQRRPAIQMMREYPVDNQIRITADRGSEMRIGSRSKREVTFIYVAVTGLLQRPQHKVTENTFFRLTRDFCDQPPTQTASTVGCKMNA
jgi:hypothetical protein